jgi:nucleoside-diphosphate-sugar epimerase
VARLLITGSSGFIGSHIVEGLRGHDIFTCDRKTGLELKDLKQESKPVDYVIHLAGSCSTSKSIDDPLSDFEDNASGTLQALEYARRYKAKFIYTSSVKARQAPVMTPYGVSKYIGEMYCNEYHHLYGLEYVVNRPGTIYGEGQEGSPESGWVAWFLKAKGENLPVKIFGTGNQVRDLLYVKDYVELIKSQIKSWDLYKNRVWDVGGGVANAVSVKELADYLNLDYEYALPRQGDSLEYIGENKTPRWSPVTKWKDRI